jgi:uncharacterized BrkB/YihY/UPF0761 family membrane protein
VVGGSLGDPIAKPYGTLATGIILLLWLNYSAFAFVVGAGPNSERERQTTSAQRAESVGFS